MSLRCLICVVLFIAIAPDKARDHPFSASDACTLGALLLIGTSKRKVIVETKP